MFLAGRGFALQERSRISVPVLLAWMLCDLAVQMFSVEFEAVIKGIAEACRLGRCDGRRSEDRLPLTQVYEGKDELPR